MRALALVLSLAACGRLRFEPTADDASGDGAGGGDAQSGSGDGSIAMGDGAAGGPCGATVALADDFGDGVTAPEWTTLTGSNLTLAETGGFLQITFATNVPSNQKAGYQQTATLDYTGSCTIVELDEIPSATANGRLEIRLSMGPTNYVLFEVLAGELYAISYDGTNIMNVYMAAWTLASHRFLRIREHNGSWFWDISGDGVTYNQAATTTQAIAGQTAATLALFVSTSAGVSNGGQVQFGSAQVLVP